MTQAKKKPPVKRSSPPAKATSNEVAILTPPEMLSVAISQGQDISMIEKLMDLQDRWEDKQAEKSFTLAMAEFRRSCPAIEKLEKGQSNKFAGLAHAIETVRELMAQNGLAHRWRTNQETGGVISVTCIVTHIDGHSEETSLSSLPDGSGNKNAVQAIGSTVSYLERYTFFAALGLASKEQDDDGVTAGQPMEGDYIEALPQYPEADFNSNFDTYRNLILSGKKSVATIINTLQTKYTLTEDQIKQIKAVGNEGASQ